MEQSATEIKKKKKSHALTLYGMLNSYGIIVGFSRQLQFIENHTQLQTIPKLSIAVDTFKNLPNQIICHSKI